MYSCEENVSLSAMPGPSKSIKEIGIGGEG